MIRILFVCTGNTCRSAMAKVLFQKILNEEEATEEIEVDSAGTIATPGASASPLAIKIMMGRGADLRTHQAKPISPKLIQDADLIFAMEERHLDAVVDMVSESKAKTFLLKAFAVEPNLLNDANIPDPIGQGCEAYEKCLQEIEKALQGLVNWLKKK